MFKHIIFVKRKDKDEIVLHILYIMTLLVLAAIT